VIYLYAICWNEEQMLPFFFRHYDEIVDRYVIYDDGSSDRTVDICRVHPKVELRRFERVVPDSIVASVQILKNACWKESRGIADWVIVVDIDEHLYHPIGLRAYLERCERLGVTAIPALGYQMVSTSLPPPNERLSRAITAGAPDSMYSKLSIFDPTALTDTHFSPGQHGALPRGNIVFPPTDELLQLHYKFISLAYVLRRNQLLWSRRGKTDLANNWGHQYNVHEAGVAECFRNLEAAAVDLMQPNYVPHRDHEAHRWWREPRIMRRLWLRRRLHAALLTFAQRIGV
jgi:glycosyltransferase involved in cell wall biosynthesis